MGDNDEAGRLTRRRFVQLSGVAGASAILTGAGHDLAASQPPPPTGGPSPSPLCGYTNDPDRIWNAAKGCTPGVGSCHKKGPNSVVLDGTDHHPPNYITVPTERVKGIECPWITDHDAPNYWEEAYVWALNTKPEVTTNAHELAFGINSQAGRTSDANQLHIHIARVRDYSQYSLTRPDQSAVIVDNFKDWHQSRVKITGWNGQIKTEHVYRVVIVSSLSKNLFEELEKMVGQANMHLQTLIVIARPAGGWYIVNSDLNLTATSYPNVKGSNTCDPLLLIQAG